MKIMIAHNSYQQSGGEDAVVRAEAALLRQHGHDVHVCEFSNSEITSLRNKVDTLISVHSNRTNAAKIVAEATSRKIDVVHVHNFFPLITPYIHRALHDAGIPSVQTLHNYRIACAAATLLRKQRVCEKCVDGSPLWSVVHRCYRSSLPGSIGLYRMIRYIKNNRVWDYSAKVIALTEFSRRIYLRAGVPSEKITVKPNFVPDNGRVDRQARVGFLFVGRISEEKGIHLLVEAMRLVPSASLRVAGDGPLLAQLKQAAPENIVFLGRLTPSEIRDEMIRAAALVMPSIWYEGMPMTVLEAFEVGLPVLASDIGGFPEMVNPHVNGLLFPPASIHGLAESLIRVNADDKFLIDCGNGARKTYEERYAPAMNYEALKEVYQCAIIGFEGPKLARAEDFLCQH